MMFKSKLLKKAEMQHDLEQDGQRLIHFIIKSPDPKALADWDVRVEVRQDGKLAVQITDEASSRFVANSIKELQNKLMSRVDASREMIAKAVGYSKADIIMANMRSQIVSDFDSIEPAKFQPWWRNRGE